MKKADTEEIILSITVYLCFGIPVVACAILSLKVYIEYGDWFLSGVLFLLSSLICAMIVNAFAPVVFVLSLILDGIWWLTKKTISGIRYLINPHSRNPV